MAKCPNCGTALSCGCQKKKASNGMQGCNNCIAKLEQQVKTSTNAANLLLKPTNNRPK